LIKIVISITEGLENYNILPFNRRACFFFFGPCYLRATILTANYFTVVIFSTTKNTKKSGFKIYLQTVYFWWFHVFVSHSVCFHYFFLVLGIVPKIPTKVWHICQTFYSFKPLKTDTYFHIWDRSNLSDQAKHRIPTC
jgi:hypothetical protein